MLVAYFLLLGALSDRGGGHLAVKRISHTEAQRR